MGSSWEGGGLDKGNVCILSWLVTTSQPESGSSSQRLSLDDCWHLVTAIRFYMTFGLRPWVWALFCGGGGGVFLETLRFASSRAVARWSDADFTLPTVHPVARWLGSILTWLWFPISEYLKVLFIFQINSNIPLLCPLYSCFDLNYISSLLQMPPSSLQFCVCLLSVVARKKMVP